MDKNELARKIQATGAFSDDEKAALLQLLRERKKYGLVWEEKPETIQEVLRDSLPVLVEDESKRIINYPPANALIIK